MDKDSASTPALTGSFFPVHIDSVDDDILAMDLYIRHGGGPTALYRACGIEFNQRERERLLDQGIEFLYVPMAQHRVYREALGRRLDKLYMRRS